MAAGIQLQGNFVFYGLAKYFSISTSRFPQYDFEEIMSGRVSWRANIAQACFFTSMFPQTPAAQTAAAKWLRGFKWKEILFSRVWHNILQFYRATFLQYDFEDTMSCGVCWRANIAQDSFFTSMFPHTPAVQTAAAKWLRGFNCMEILFSMVWQNIVLVQRAVYPQYDFWRNYHQKCVLACQYRASMLLYVDVSTHASCTNCCGKWLRGINWKAILFFKVLQNVVQI